MSGLAYDAKSERLLYTSEGQVWAGKAGEEYKAIATVPIGPDVPSMVGFALPDGRYAIADHALYLRAEGQKLPPDNEIIVQGWADEAAYRSFSKENAGFRVLFQMEFKSSDDIAQALISGDESADIYVVPMDNTFRAIVKKGYALPLSGSSILAEETAKMYPHIQRAISDENGSPVAYPFSFSLVNWLYNELLWKRVFGEEALPESYIEFLDAMLRWEKEYADAHTNIVFSRDFDYVFWLQNIINDFSRQYGKGNEALSFANTHLRAALEKLAQVVSARRTNGRSIMLLKIRVTGYFSMRSSSTAARLLGSM